MALTPINELDVYNLFKALTDSNSVLRSAFVGYLDDLNTGNYNDDQYDDKNYPVALTVPPMSSILTDTDKKGWEEFQFVIYFLCTQFYNNDGSTPSPDPDDGTSGHTIPQYFQDMSQIARDFILKLKAAQSSNSIFKNTIILSKEPPQMDRVAYFMNDRLAGVKLSFKCRIFFGCETPTFNTIPGGVPIPVVYPVSSTHVTHEH